MATATMGAKGDWHSAFHSAGGHRRLAAAVEIPGEIADLLEHAVGLGPRLLRRIDEVGRHVGRSQQLLHPGPAGGNDAVPARHGLLLGLVERLAGIDVRAQRRALDAVTVAHLPGKAAGLDHACDEGVVHPGAVRHRGGRQVGGIDHLGDGIVPGCGAFHLAFGTRQLGLVVEQLEFRGGLAPALLQRACEFVAAGKVDGRERRDDGIMAGLLGLLGSTELGARIVLAKQRALSIAAIVTQREHAVEDRLVGIRETFRLETLAVAAQGPRHLERRRGQRADGQQGHQRQEKGAYRFLKHCHGSGAYSSRAATLHRDMPRFG
ncbi:hypothetical protein ABH974_000428 [Bradyrhizobium ottawaense]